LSRAQRSGIANAQGSQWWCAAEPGLFQMPEVETVPAQGRDKWCAVS
jgi:hypothetical protein